MLTSIAIKILISFLSLITINGQILRRQYVSDSQQVQVPIRRINIPVDLKNTGSSNDQRTDVRTTTDKNCAKCLEKRLVQHYMSRGCTPVIKAGCDCPSRYECPTNERLIDSTRELSEREQKSLDTSSLCRYTDCPFSSDPNFQKGCTPVYSDGQCCPTRYICPKRNSLRMRGGLQNGSLMCEFEGRKYPIDSTLYTDERCVDCLCRIPPQFTCVQRKYCS